MISQYTENKTKFYKIFAYTSASSANVDRFAVGSPIQRRNIFFFEFLMPFIINGNVNNNDNVS